MCFLNLSHTYFSIVTELFSDQRTGITAVGGEEASKAACGLQNSRDEAAARGTSV